MKHLTRALFYFPAMGSRCETKAKRTSSSSSTAFPSQLLLLLLLSSFYAIAHIFFHSLTSLTQFFLSPLSHIHFTHLCCDVKLNIDEFLEQFCVFVCDHAVLGRGLVGEWVSTL